MVLTRLWQRFHRIPPYYRWPAKLACLTLVVALVLYPRVWLIPRWAHRIANLDTVITPDEPGVANLEQQLQASLRPAGLTLPELTDRVEQLVYHTLPYAHDWDTWGVMDYLPTPAEALQRGQEDCDGRAALAAALLRRLGHQAHLVSDLKHTWVIITDPTDQTRIIAELMSPGAGARSLAGTSTGTRTTLDLAAIANLGRALAYGIAVFPLARELIILAALVLVTLHPRTTRTRAILAAVLLLTALALLRAAGAAPDTLAQHPALAWLGLLTAVGGWTILAYKSPCRPRTPSATQPQA